MSKTYKVKVALGGASNSGKNAFLNRTTLVEEEIGVSFKSIDCLVNEIDSYKFILWDLNARKLFRFMYPTFCKGAKACLLFFNISERESFTELPDWIKLFKKIEGDVPIFLIATIPNLGAHEVSEEEIKDLIKKYNLHEQYFIFLGDQDQNAERKALFHTMIEEIDQKCKIKRLRLMSPLEDQQFINFFERFSSCPICEAHNHISYIAKFFYSKDPESMSMLNYLLSLVKKSHKFDKKYLNKINIGVPCCKCYKRIF